MSALAFAGGAVVGAPAAYLSMRQNAKNISQIRDSSMSPDGKVLLQLVFSPQGIPFAHDILSATSAKIQNRSRWVQFEKSTKEYKDSFAVALSSLVNKYKGHTVHMQAAWPAGLAGLFAGSVVGVVGGMKDFLSNSLLMEYNEQFLLKTSLSPEQKVKIKNNAAAIAVGAMLDVPQESPEALLTVVLQNSQDVQALWQVIDSELNTQLGQMPPSES